MSRRRSASDAPPVETQAPEFVADFAHDGGTDGNKLHRVEAADADAALEWAKLNPPAPGYSVVGVYQKVRSGESGE